jgi:hypothetical protein
MSREFPDVLAFVQKDAQYENVQINMLLIWLILNLEVILLTGRISMTSGDCDLNNTEMNTAHFSL